MFVNTSLYNAVRNSCIKHPNSTAAYYLGQDFSYRDFLTLINRSAEGLFKVGITPSDVVTICSPNTLDSIALFYAVNKIGAIVHPVHPLLGVSALERDMSETKSRYLIITNMEVEKYSYLLKRDIKIIVIDPVRTLGCIKRWLFYKKHNIKYKNMPAGMIDWNLILEEGPSPYNTDAKYTQRHPRSTAVLLDSGGSTGIPKIIKLSSRAINALINEGPNILGITEEQFQGRSCLAVLPMFHGFGLAMGIHAWLGLGGTINIQPKFNVGQTIKDISNNKINYILGVPTLYNRLLNNSKFQGDILRNLDCCFIGGDFVSPALINDFNTRMVAAGSACRLLEGYGLTETVTVCSVNTLNASRKDSIGKPIQCAHIKIMTPDGKLAGSNVIGEIIVGGPTLMNGYLKHQAPFTVLDHNKYIKTGDWGYFDDDGYLYFKQRMKRLIKIHGVGVCPSDIEKIVTQIPGIKQAAVVSPRPDNLTLFITGDQKVDLKSIIKTIPQKIVDNLSPYAVPHDIYVLDVMPTTPIGKIDYQSLQKRE